MKLQKDVLSYEDVVYDGDFLRADIALVNEYDKQNKYADYSHTEVGDVKDIVIHIKSSMYVLDTDPISALEIFKEEVEELIKILKDKQNEK